MPTGVWMPVVCIITRARIGCTQRVDVADDLHRACPSRRRACPSSCPAATADFGFSRTVVSIIVSGAGSVDVSARPILPNTRSTSGRPSASCPSAGRSSPPRGSAARAASSACRGSSLRRSPAGSPSGTAQHAPPPGISDEQAGAGERVAIPDHAASSATDTPRTATLSWKFRRATVSRLKIQTTIDRQQEERQQRRERHRERLAVGQRIEQPRLALLEEEHRQERREDDQQREQQRPGDRRDRVDDDLAASRRG